MRPAFRSTSRRPPRHPAEQLERGEVELVILPKFMSESQPTALLFEETYTCIVWTGNDAGRRHAVAGPVHGLGHVSSRFGTSLTSFEEHFLKDSGYDRRIEVSTTNFTSLPHFVIGTNRIATMHTRLARMLACYYPIRLLAPPIAFPKLEMCMQWNRFLDQDPSHLWLRKLLIEIAMPSQQDSNAPAAPGTGASPAAPAHVRLKTTAWPRRAPQLSTRPRMRIQARTAPARHRC
jgi:LysR family nod box-dependent transcriptional activator